MGGHRVCHEFDVLTCVESVPTARHEAEEVLTKWGVDDEQAHTACLILTELVTNVVRHAADSSPTASVRLATDDDTVTIAVADRDATLPGHSRSGDDLGGRGLPLVRALAAEADGSFSARPDPAGTGKTISVRLRRRPGT